MKAIKNIQIAREKENLKIKPKEQSTTVVES